MQCPIGKGSPLIYYNIVIMYDGGATYYNIGVPMPIYRYKPTLQKSMGMDEVSRIILLPINQ